MKLEIKLPPVVTRIGKTFFAHYGILSFILAMCTLIYCVYSIQIIMDAPTDTAYREEQLQKNTKTSFDTITIEHVKLLRSTDNPISTSLPSGRINPFTE